MLLQNLTLGGVAAIFCAVYSASRRRAPTRTPSVRLAVQSSFQQIPCVAATEAVCGTHSLRATRLKLIESTNEMKPYARVTFLKARSSVVNWCAI